MIEHIFSALSSFVLHLIDSWGYVGVFVLMFFESANIPISAAVIMVLCGFFVATGRFLFWPVVFVGTMGNLTGALVSYGIAYRFGEQAMSFLSHFLIVSKKDILRAEKWFRKIGLWAAFVTRFIPFVRSFISFPLGMARVRVELFSVLTFIGSLLWSMTFVYVGMVLWQRLDLLKPYIYQFNIVSIVMILVVIGVTLVYYRKNKKGIING
ncbi:MAG: DedA family protein [bacterium]